ncbi:hypothetical protein [Kribbella shirazensis]|uniref:Uncharacterized protein n=1 Tax=Kribbella shirazensis TaxID=1105143 RepID=A0A7X6A0D1_9ACTN|nr:hypothetical protein [Kribbella shirazensis]NIK56059.1 hypothetical protein [Kribbella shirazensis]
MKRWVALCAGTALLAGCGGEPEPAPSPVATASSSSAPAAASSEPTAGPLGTAAYQAELSRIDQVLAGSTRALTRVRTAEALGEAMSTLAESLNTIAIRLAALKVTSRLTAVHTLLQERIGVAATRLTSSAEQTVEDARCGGAAYTSQKVQRQLRADLGGALVQLQRLKLAFGQTLPDPGPAPKDERPDSGAVLVRRGPEGLGRLKITNGTAKDVAVSIVGDGQPPGSPQLMVYLQATKSTTVNRIGGAYHLYFKSGADWDADRRQFRSGCSFKKFDQTFTRNQGWQVNLQPRPDGNADTTEIEAY